MPSLITDNGTFFALAALAQVGLFEVCHIHKRHTSGIEAEHEQITGKVQCWVYG